MYANYDSPLEAKSLNWLSQVFSGFIGTLVDYSAHELKFNERGDSVKVPIRIKTFTNVNQGYVFSINHDSVEIFASHLPSTGMYENYKVLIPRIVHDPRYYQILKSKYVDLFSIFLRKIYGSVGTPVLYSPVVGVVAGTEIKVAHFVNKIVDLLVADSVFTLTFAKGCWVIGTKVNGESVTFKWLTPNAARAFGNRKPTIKRKPTKGVLA